MSLFFDRMGFLAGLWREARWKASAGLVLAVITTLANIVLLAVSGWFITGMALAGAGGGAFNYFFPAALIRAAAIARAGGRYLERLVTHDATLRLIARLRPRLFAALAERPGRPASPDAALHGADLAGRLGGDLDAVQRLSLQGVLPVLVALIVVPIGITVCAHFLPQAALVLTAGMVVAGGLVPLVLARAGRRVGPPLVTARVALRVALVDLIGGQEELRACGALPRFQDRAREVEDRAVRLSKRAAWIESLGLAGLALLTQVTVWGMVLVAAGQVDGPILVLLAFLGLALFEPLGPLPEAFQRLGASFAALDRVRALAPASPDTKRRASPALPASPSASPSSSPSPSPSPSPARATAPAVRLDSVSVAGIEGGRPALREVSLELPPGGRLGVVGPSGAGKSTLVSLLAGTLAWDRGRVLVNERPVEGPHDPALHGLVALAPQAPLLLAGSVRRNLRLGAPEASDEALRAALETVVLSKWLAALPEGLDTPLGAAGRPVSGGEARRLSLARALLGAGPVLVLDEPGEGLDPALEARVLDQVLTAAGTAGRAVLLVTHRPHGLERMDKVACLDQGRVVDAGAPWDLARMPGPFRQFLEAAAL
ncbi:thiol reductant ABC exporter subunit CydC [Pararhodospirillum oryzae]|uniref:Cysteine/glutathione ABC transporter ATP-binding protein/permease CydC n=1 Tax=Pararhodospirillum oryzae TaxID=478448 RepID=A0A512H715_9PROT|nr:thiol reductant ABC exporter subunit CydC [Pararhodospirillum oryzae]GEO81221.1 cysteine/glutathione ABC transporter ATP-binding protein/permease CydC [Pararhodospirillum oryzae]